MACWVSLTFCPQKNRCSCWKTDWQKSTLTGICLKDLKNFAKMQTEIKIGLGAPSFVASQPKVLFTICCQKYRRRQRFCWVRSLLGSIQMLTMRSCIFIFAFFSVAVVIKSNHVNDSRRSYHCIKFLVALAHKCALAKDYLLQNPTKWQWAVNWLKKKVNGCFLSLLWHVFRVRNAHVLQHGQYFHSSINEIVGGG